MPNSFDLKLIKTVEIPEMMETGFDYAIAGRVSITDINKHDENNGEFTYTHMGLFNPCFKDLFN